MKYKFLFFLSLLLFYIPVLSQPSKDTINYNLINNLALKGEVKEALTILGSLKLYRQGDILYKKKFENRFKYKKDKSDFLNDVPSPLHDLFKLYQQYWRMCLLDNTKINDSLFREKAVKFYQQEEIKSRFTNEKISVANLENIANDYILSKEHRANDFGRTGFLYDLIVWKDFQTVNYNVQLIERSVSVKVNFIKKFISLGWLAYARMGKGPGGWATEEELYCVADLYRDHSSEKFLICYLKHEAQHFYDFKYFPGLPSKDLEYRAKLVELFYSDKHLFELIASFKEGAKNDITNAHPFANYSIIRNMSRLLFSSEYEEEISKWKKIKIATIQAAAKALYFKSNAEIREGVYLN